MFRNGIFISYSHADKKWLDTVKVFLKPYIRNEKIDVWSDEKMNLGAQWEQEIYGKMETCRVAMLLVTANFIASDFIMEKELPLILSKAQSGELIICWIAVSPAAYKFTGLEKLQCGNNPEEPLSTLPVPEREALFVKIAENVAKAMDINVVSNTLKVIDKFYPQQLAMIKGEHYEKVSVDFSVQAKQEHDKIDFLNRDQTVQTTITGDDIDKLGTAHKEYIRSNEEAMKILFKRWTELLPKSYSSDKNESDGASAELMKIRKSLCDILNHILDYLGSINYDLSDHYHHIRTICAQ